MQRRHFLQALSASALLSTLPGTAWARDGKDYRKPLILIELKGGNDGLNTVVPYADPLYARLRPKLALPRDQILQLNGQLGLHPKLQPLMPLWQQQQLAILHNVGYPQPNQSHFRSIEIWDTASDSQSYLPDGWLTRQFSSERVPASYAADAAILGSQTLGPLLGRSRTVVLGSRKLEGGMMEDGMAGQQVSALEHLLKVETDIGTAARGLHYGKVDTEFPKTGFGSDLKRVAQLIAGNSQVAAFRLTLGSFDTHTNQLATQDRLLGELADGLAALSQALQTMGKWNDTLILTYAEFGRRVAENESGGTDHGMANVHFALGGRVKGGFHGEGPRLHDLDNGNLRYQIDFRSVYASVIDRWWNSDSSRVLGQRYSPVAFI